MSPSLNPDLARLVHSCKQHFNWAPTTLSLILGYPRTYLNNYFYKTKANLDDLYTLSFLLEHFNVEDKELIKPFDFCISSINRLKKDTKHKLTTVLNDKIKDVQEKKSHNVVVEIIPIPTQQVLDNVMVDLKDILTISELKEDMERVKKVDNFIDKILALIEYGMPDINESASLQRQLEWLGDLSNIISSSINQKRNLLSTQAACAKEGLINIEQSDISTEQVKELGEFLKGII